MADPKYPNESSEYRQAREALLEEEIALIAQVKAVAEKRRQLPMGGKVKDNYLFVGANDDTLGNEIRFSELFGDKQTLLIYSYMFGPDWDNPCPSCTSLIDGFDRASISVTNNAAFTVVAKAPARRLNDWARERGWRHINLVSAEKSQYLARLPMCGERGRRKPLADHACVHQARRQHSPFLGIGKCREITST